MRPTLAEESDSGKEKAAQAASGGLLVGAVSPGRETVSGGQRRQILLFVRDLCVDHRIIPPFERVADLEESVVTVRAVRGRIKTRLAGRDRHHLLAWPRQRADDRDYIASVPAGRWRRRDADLTHAFKANFIYGLPMGPGHALSSDNSFVRRLIGGWNISSIFTWQGGAPFSILSRRGTVSRDLRNSDAGTASISGTQGDVEALIGTFATPDGMFWFNPSAIDSDKDVVNDDALICVPFGPAGFCNPAPGTHGNLALRAFDGPMYFNWDFSIFKKTQITETTAIEFRAEFFNLPNHPTFEVDDTGSDRRTNINSSTFGKMDDMIFGDQQRIIQFALKFIF